MESQKIKECEHFEDVINGDFGDDSGFIDVSCSRYISCPFCHD
jgi:hypothetical protein